MSWQQARKDAQRWLDTLNLPTKSMKGQTINLNAQAASLRGEAKYIAMIIRAAKRILRGRGIEATIDEPRPLGMFPKEEEPGESA